MMIMTFCNRVNIRCLGGISLIRPNIVAQNARLQQVEGQR